MKKRPAPSCGTGRADPARPGEKERKKSTPIGVVSTGVLPLAVALLLTVEDQIIHIANELVVSHRVLLSLFLFVL